MQIRDRFLDYLKGVSIYLVAIGHCFNQEDYEHPYLAMFSMPLFMAISGYFFIRLLRRLTSRIIS